MNRRVNWQFIKPLWASGMSNVEITRQYADVHGATEWKPTITETAIRKTAKRKKWRRRLAGKVKTATEEKIVRGEVRDSNHGDDDAIIDEAAGNRAGVVLRHRKDLIELAMLEEDLVRRLINDEDQVIIGWHKGEATEHIVKMGYYERVRSLLQLNAARIKRMDAEREAWGFTRDDTGGKEETDEVSVNLYLGGRNGNSEN